MGVGNYRYHGSEKLHWAQLPEPSKALGQWRFWRQFALHCKNKAIGAFSTNIRKPKQLSVTNPGKLPTLWIIIKLPFIITEGILWALFISMWSQFKGKPKDMSASKVLKLVHLSGSRDQPKSILFAKGNLNPSPKNYVWLFCRNPRSCLHPSNILKYSNSDCGKYIHFNL